MEEIKNKIITISGEPVSGKGTVVKLLVEKYQKMGYNVHVIETGKVFRELAQKEYMKMYPERKDANISEIQKDEGFATKRTLIDEMVDGEIVKKGKEINKVERPNDVYILDSRLAWSNIPNSFAVRLTVDSIIAGERVLADTKRGKDDKYKDLADAIKRTAERKKLEIERYKKEYGVDLTDENNYDLIVDTSYSNSDELADIIINGEKAYRTNYAYPKYWSSPVKFLPLQLGRITGAPTILGSTIESLAEDIRKEGYIPTLGTLEIIEKDGKRYLLEGNHRTFGALSAGKTLLPYEITHKDDKIANDRLRYYNTKSYMEYLYDYAEGIEYYGGKIGKIKQLEKFSINDLMEMNRIDEKQFTNSGEDR